MLSEDNTKLLSECLDIDLSVRSNLYVSGKVFFDNISRAIDSLGKTFELKAMSGRNKCLSSIGPIVERSPSGYDDHFKWIDQKNTIFPYDKVRYHDGIMISTASRTVRSDFGMLELGKGTRLLPAITVDGMESGVIAVYGNRNPAIMSADIHLLQFLNYDPEYEIATVTTSFRSKSIGSLKKKNIVLYDMIPSLINHCKAGITLSIKSSKTAEKEVAKQASRDIEFMANRDIRINGKLVVDCVSDNILEMSTKDAREAAFSITKACRKIGKQIPQVVADILATMCKVESRVDHETKNFIFGIIDSFFYVTRGQRVVFTDKYGGKSYQYCGVSDHATARKIAKMISSIPSVGDALEGIILNDIIFSVHEYAKNEVLVPKVDDINSKEIGGASIILDFKNDDVLFSDVKGKKKSSAIKWMSAMKWSKEVKPGRERIFTYSFLFDGDAGAHRALASVLATNIAYLLGISFKDAVNLPSGKSASLIKSFFLSPSFNIFGLKNLPDIIPGSKDNTISFHYPEDEPSTPISIMLTKHYVDGGIHMREEKLPKNKQNTVYNLATLTPTKAYAYSMYRALKYIATVYSDMSHCRDVLSKDGELLSLCLYHTKRLFKGRKNF